MGNLQNQVRVPPSTPRIFHGLVCQNWTRRMNTYWVFWLFLSMAPTCPKPNRCEEQGECSKQSFQQDRSQGEARSALPKRAHGGLTRSPKEQNIRYGNLLANFLPLWAPVKVAQLFSLPIGFVLIRKDWKFLFPMIAHDPLSPVSPSVGD